VAATRGQLGNLEERGTSTVRSRYRRTGKEIADREYSERVHAVNCRMCELLIAP
jgi:hypothetical protein